MKNLKTGIFMALLAALLLTACDQVQKEELDKVTEDLKSLAQQAGRQLEQLGPDKVKDLTTEEIEKLFIFEYLVHDLPVAATPQEIQHTLNLLGRERWECFDMERTESQLRFFCKRRPKTYLRYLPPLIR